MSNPVELPGLSQRNSLQRLMGDLVAKSAALDLCERWVRRHVFIRYPAADDVVSSAQFRLGRGVGSDHSHLALDSPAGNGEGAIARYLLRKNAPYFVRELGRMITPVATIDLPMEETRQGLMSALAGALGLERVPRQYILEDICVLYRQHGVRLLIVRSFDDYTQFPATLRRLFAVTLTTLAAEASFSYLLIGGVRLHEALSAARLDAVTRTLTLPIWNNDRIVPFLDRLENLLPFRATGELAREGGRLIELSGGRLGDVVCRVKHAALESLRRGHHQLDMAYLGDRQPSMYVHRPRCTDDQSPKFDLPVFVAMRRRVHRRRPPLIGPFPMPDESIYSWFARFADALRISAEELFTLYKDDRETIVHGLRQWIGCPQARRIENELSDLKARCIGRHLPCHELTSQYCWRCVERFRSRGYPIYLREAWKSSEETFCPIDRWPLLNWTHPDGSNFPRLSDGPWNQHQLRAVLNARRGRTSHLRAPNYLDWNALWPSLANWERVWRSGRQQSLRAAVMDVGALLLSNFEPVRARALLDDLINRPDEWGYPQRPFSGPYQVINVIGCCDPLRRRTALCIALYALGAARIPCGGTWRPREESILPWSFLENLSACISPGARPWLEQKTHRWSPQWRDALAKRGE